MLWIGLTGGIASGKSTAAKILRQMGYPVIDADQIAKDVVGPGTPGLELVLKAFGPDLRKPDQSLDRKKMAEIVFSNPQELQKLEALLHPLVKQKVQELKELEQKKSSKIVFYDVPLLFEKRMQADFDCVVVVSCSEALQKSRLRSRDSMNEAQIAARLKNQIPLAEKEKGADFVIKNEGTLEHLQAELLRVCKAIA